MKKNLALIEKHRQKMWLLVGFIIFLFLYLCFSVFWITSISYLQKIDQQNIDTKMERITNILQTRETFIENADKETQKVIQSVLEHSYIIANSSQVITDTLQNSDIIHEISHDESLYIDNWLYQRNIYSDDGIIFDIVTKIPTRNYIKTNLLTLLILIALAPFIFVLLAFIGCRLMHRVYTPIKEIVISLEDYSLSINHELKTSLSEIISTLELAKITGEYEDSIEQSLASTKRINNILDSLWILIRFVNSEYRKQKSNVTMLLNACIEDFTKMIDKKNLKLIKKYDQNANWKQYIDMEPLQLCFNNILKNAIRYSDTWGKIEVNITRNYFSIKDFGVWIEEKNIPKIFDRYFRENYSREWSGIWLSLVKRICDKYGWKIEVDTKKDSFTKFTLYFRTLNNKSNKKASS